jgi:predicted ArsR family transcriptional regulator
MQATRERILRILKETEAASVDDLSRMLGLTPVTIRHHLDVLRGEGLVGAPTVRRRKAPGRPQHVYSLTERASEHFPKQYDQLASLLLDEIRARGAGGEVDRTMQQIGLRLAAQFRSPADLSFEERLAAVVEFLNARGYLASWERRDDGAFLLHVANCPYEQVAAVHREVCAIDQTLLSQVLGTTPERVAWAVKDSHQCTYVIQPPVRPDELSEGGGL